MGHIGRSCKQPAMEAADGDVETEEGFVGQSSSGDGGWEQLDAAGGSGQPEWESNNMETQSSGGGAPIAVGSGSW